MRWQCQTEQPEEPELANANRTATIPETNIAPENRAPLEKEIPIGNHHL